MLRTYVLREPKCGYNRAKIALYLKDPSMYILF